MSVIVKFHRGTIFTVCLSWSAHIYNVPGAKHLQQRNIPHFFEHTSAWRYNAALDTHNLNLSSSYKFVLLNWSIFFYFHTELFFKRKSIKFKNSSDYPPLFSFVTCISLLTKLNFTKSLLIKEEVVRHVIMSASNKH